MTDLTLIADWIKTQMTEEVRIVRHFPEYNQVQLDFVDDGRLYKRIEAWLIPPGVDVQTKLDQLPINQSHTRIVHLPTKEGQTTYLLTFSTRPIYS